MSANQDHNILWKPIFPQIGRYGISAVRDKNVYRFDIPRVGEVFVGTCGNVLKTYLTPGTRPEMLQDALTGYIFPLLWGLRGGYLLHGATVATPFGAILLFGPSGAGKSTLATSFEGHAGCRVLDDDAALLEENPAGIWAHPTRRGVSLWEDSLAALGGAFPSQRRLPAYGSKYRARREDQEREGQEEARETEWPKIGDSGSVPLVAAFHLPRPTPDDPHQAAFEPMDASEKHLRLGRSGQRVDLTDREVLKRQFAFTSRLIADLPICRLRFPRTYDALPEVQAAVLAFVEQAQAQ